MALFVVSTQWCSTLIIQFDFWQQCSPQFLFWKQLCGSFCALWGESNILVLHSVWLTECFLSSAWIDASHNCSREKALWGDPGADHAWSWANCCRQGTVVARIDSPTLALFVCPFDWDSCHWLFGASLFIATALILELRFSLGATQIHNESFLLTSCIHFEASGRAVWWAHWNCL